MTHAIFSESTGVCISYYAGTNFMQCVNSNKWALESNFDNSDKNSYGINISGSKDINHPTCRRYMDEIVGENRGPGNDIIRHYMRLI